MHYRNRLSMLVTVAALAVYLGVGFPATAQAQVTAYPGMTIRTADRICSVGATGHMGSAQYAVTAAHCFQQRARVYNANGGVIGWFEQSYGDDSTVANLGFALIRLANNVGISASLGTFGIQSTYTEPFVGEGVCHVGSATSWTCGTITSVADNHFITDFYADRGDSGGIVYNQTPEGRAAFLGILIGGMESGGVVVETAGYLRDTIDARAVGNDSFRWYVE
ncbi:trypsin-like serine protease [Nocardia sp. NPDC057440]|uniref:trypsin-like serine protease n=1 Tax=Nocardia sp. NPDC057440 TaxID=3346134 RepID=UPI003671EF22